MSVDLEQIGVIAIPTGDECNLWVGFDPGHGMISWQVLYSEKPYKNYTVGVDFAIDPYKFAISRPAIITEGITENRVLIQKLKSGKLYKIRVLAYDTSIQSSVSKYITSREIYTAEETDHLEMIAIATSQEVNSGKGEVSLTWNKTERDENGYDIEFVLGGSGNVNATKLPAGTKSFVTELASSTYQFKLKRYDVDSNVVEFVSNIVLVPNRTPPAIPIFNSSMLTWLDQGPNSADAQRVQIQISIPVDSAYIQVIAVAGVGTKSSEKISTNGYYVNTGVADNQTVSYKLRAIDANGNYADSEIMTLAIDKRTVLMPPSFI